MRYAVLPLIALAVPAAAAERSYTVTGFDRVRVEGPFEVRLTVGGSPRAAAEADPRLLDRLEVAVQGSTLVVRIGAGGWGEQPAPANSGAAPVVTLTTPALASASVAGGGRLTVTGRVRGARLDLALSGAGALAADGIDADQLSATLVGAGSLALSGRAGRARLVDNGPGSIAATPLSAGDLSIGLNGTGEVAATARYTATVSAAGLGRVTVAGPATCRIVARGGGPILCGKVGGAP